MRIKLVVLLFTLLLTCNILYAGTWEEFQTQSPPAARTGHIGIYDSYSRSMITMGDSACSDANIYYLDLRTAEWIVKNSSTTVKRTAHSVVDDTSKKRAIIFGGSTLGWTSSSGYDNKTYAWNFVAETWELLTTTGTPPIERVSHSAIYDSANNRMIIFGGLDKDFIYMNDVYSLDLTQTPPLWSELTTTGTPPRKRFRHTAIYDPVGKRMLIFGGTSASSANDDLWSLDLTTLAWNQLSPGGGRNLPSDVTGHTAVYDPDTGTSGSMIIFGGTDPLIPGVYLNKTYILDLAQMVWEEIQMGLDPPSGTSGHIAVYDTYDDRMVTFGGYNGTNDMNSCYTFSVTDLWPPSSDTEEVFNYPNPFDAGAESTNICFYLDSAAQVSVKIFTLVGDLVKTWSVDGERGINKIIWDGRNGMGKLVGNGGYICVVDKSGSVSKFKIAVIK